MADTWRESAGKTNIRSYATGAEEGEDLPVAILGSGSDYTVFFNRLGIASLDLVFDGPYGVYHSVITLHWMATVGIRATDPRAIARWGSLALRFANADLIPLDAPAYGKNFARYAEGARLQRLNCRRRSPRLRRLQVLEPRIRRSQTHGRRPPSGIGGSKDL